MRKPVQGGEMTESRSQSESVTRPKSAKPKPRMLPENPRLQSFQLKLLLDITFIKHYTYAF